MCMGKKERDIQQATLFQAIQRQFPSCKKRGGSEPRLRRKPARPLVSSACLACFPGGGNRVLPSPRTVEALGQPSVPQQHASPSLVLNDYNQGNVKSHKKTALRFKTKICVFIPTLLFFKTRKKKKPPIAWIQIRNDDSLHFPSNVLFIFPSHLSFSLCFN